MMLEEENVERRCGVKMDLYIVQAWPMTSTMGCAADSAIVGVFSGQLTAYL